MEEPARRGDFAVASQQQRVEIYRRIRLCFGFGEPTIDPTREYFIGEVFDFIFSFE